MPNPNETQLQSRRNNTAEAGEFFVPPTEDPQSRNRKPIDHKQEDTRTAIALSLSIGYLLLTLCAFILSLAKGTSVFLDKEQLQAISNFLLSPINTLVSVVIGFYFGAKSIERA